MQVFRLCARRTAHIRPLCRPFATLHERAQAPEFPDDTRDSDVLIDPLSKTFYTARSDYHDYVAIAEKAIHHTRHVLNHLHLMPLPDFARQSLPPSPSNWKPREDMADSMATTLSLTRYRRMLDLLNQLHHFRRIARAAGHMELTSKLDDMLKDFEDVRAAKLKGEVMRKPVHFDEHGRTYTLGRRKTSAARVWMISSKHAVSRLASSGEKSVKTSNNAVVQWPAEIPTTEILVNNVPLNKFFPAPADRERILRPFKVAGLLGAYNVFALVRGGGSSGQSGAVAHGIAKGLAAHEPDVSEFLTKAKLLRRDPRMVERKKTGLAKARKRYTWVKR